MPLFEVLERLRVPFQSRRTRLVIEDEPRRILERIARSRSASAQRVERARILLVYAGGRTVSAIAPDLGTNRPKVERCVDKGLQLGPLAALGDLPRPGRPATIPAAARAVAGGGSGPRHRPGLPGAGPADLVLDNYGTHKTELIRKWLLKHPRHHLHFTPTSASWINQVERWFAEITRQQIRRRTYRSVRELEAAIKEYIAVCNENPKPFIWTKSANDILESLKTYCTRCSGTEH